MIGGSQTISLQKLEQLRNADSRVLNNVQANIARLEAEHEKVILTNLN